MSAAPSSIAAKSKKLELRSRVEWVLNKIEPTLTARSSPDQASILGSLIVTYIENLKNDPTLKKQSWVLMELKQLAKGAEGAGEVQNLTMKNEDIAALHEMLAGAGGGGGEDRGEHKQERVVSHEAFGDYRCTIRFERSETTLGAVQLALTIEYDPKSQQQCCAVQ